MMSGNNQGGTKTMTFGKSKARLINSTDKTKEIAKKLEEDYKFVNVLDWKICKDLIDSIDKNKENSI